MNIYLKDDTVDSPCIGICSTLFDDVCRGCGRTILEVSNWVAMDATEKKKVWERITAEGTAMRFKDSI
ncbi:DUF1289 domain-containing protein [Polynucleobacter kasalickyi]|uniref:DUF1289 domain-containing protein n=1 Tax=Polynucleobacter kasalickyi TaxID=1938817 RepID=A0A1W2BG83_9BURK|nr:DUF1289 domain-containing protein [Polynucleobacter kasalickyi]SMC71866.1 hypothetical protein SAMN06296008_11323 [Polynucleobacter kasalickyi]